MTTGSCWSVVFRLLQGYWPLLGLAAAAAAAAAGVVTAQLACNPAAHLQAPAQEPAAVAAGAVKQQKLLSEGRQFAAASRLTWMLLLLLLLGQGLRLAEALYAHSTPQALSGCQQTSACVTPGTTRRQQNLVITYSHESPC